MESMRDMSRFYCLWLGEARFLSSYCCNFPPTSNALFEIRGGGREGARLKGGRARARENAFSACGGLTNGPDGHPLSLPSSLPLAL